MTPDLKPWFEIKHAPAPGTFLCNTTEIGTGEVKEFRFGDNLPYAFRMFIHNNNGQFNAFRNSCPHFDVPLNYTPGDVFTTDRKYFRCMTHHAKFDTVNGYCVEGPCLGDALEKIPLRRDAERLLIAEPGSGQ